MSIRILMIRMSGPEPLVLLVGLLPQEADRRCDFVGVDGVKVAGIGVSLGGGDVSTSKQDTDGDLICCNKITVIMMLIQGKRRKDVLVFLNI